LNTNKVWLGSVTRQNLSVPLAQDCSTVEVGSPADKPVPLKTAQSRCIDEAGRQNGRILNPAKRAAGVLCQIRQKRLTLARIAEPGIGPVAGRARALSMRLRRSGGRPIFQVPIRPTGWNGSGDLEKCVAGCIAAADA
jgi:hypothetical protein